MAAREVELADAVVELLATAMPGESIVRTEVPVEDLVEFDQRRTYVFAGGYEDVARIGRRRVIAEAPIAVLFAEHFTDPASREPTGPVPTDWSDERRALVADSIFAVLNETGVRKADRLLGSFWPETCRLTVPVDLTRLDQQKVFWSLTEVAYREFREG